MISVFSVECKRNKWDSYRLSAIRLLLTAGHRHSERSEESRYMAVVTHLQ